jgi:3-hydroxybutyryl-CoA dehydrogenase
MKTTQSIGVIGAGTMGAGIAQVAATNGHIAVIYDTSSQALQRAKDNLESTLRKLVEKGRLTPEEKAAILGRTVYADTFNSFRDCGLIIEAVVENLQVKQGLFRELEQVVSPECLLASNTSSLSITSIASACEHPGRVLGVHFFNPAPLMPLVELIPGVQTAEKALTTARSIVDSWKKHTVLAKDTPGFIVNRVARPFYGESIRIYEEGVADMPTIDWALREIGGFRMGPFELMDFIGNDINYKVTETVWEQFFYEPRFKPSFTQKRLYEAKRFGRKTGRGYYDYSPGSSMPEPVKDTVLAGKITDRVLAMLINEAADALYMQVATRDDLDTAMTKGVNYPKGLLAWADEIGIATVLNTLQELYEEYGEDRYRPCVLLKRMAKAGARFYEGITA